ncbi:MAG TPA: hypothetical protein VJN02_12920 [Gammaproteobacteria bacterium]|nr:hypothetical protein [Gammaproteobacteria bacterium]
MIKGTYKSEAINAIIKLNKDHNLNESNHESIVEGEGLIIIIVNKQQLDCFVGLKLNQNSLLSAASCLSNLNTRILKDVIGEELSNVVTSSPH